MSAMNDDAEWLKRVDTTLEELGWLPEEAAETAGCIRDALTAAGYVVEQGWQDIATAPRDGTPVVLIGIYPDGVTWSDQYQCWWHRTMQLSSVVTKNGHWTRWPHTIPPTHWRPLSAPPAQEPSHER